MAGPGNCQWSYRTGGPRACEVCAWVDSGTGETAARAGQRLAVRDPELPQRRGEGSEGQHILLL